AVINSALEKKQREWNSSNNTQVKAKITQYITSGVIKQSSEDAASWGKVYAEAKDIVENDLGNRLSIVAASLGGSVSKKDIEGILNKYKYKKSVTYDYAEGIAKRLGIAGSGSGNAPQSEQKPDKRVTLADYEPESHVRFSAPAKQLQIVGCSDYYEFLRKYTRISDLPGSGTAFSQHTAARECAAAAREIEKAWSGKNEDSEKSAVDKVCDQISRFDSGDPASSQENYNKYLVWRAIKDIFAEFWSAMSLVEESKRAIDGRVKADMVSRLTEVTADRTASEQLLEEYCEEKKVALPKPLPTVGVCPFCENPFDKNGGMPDSCPSCHRSFMLTCPRCGRRVNYAEKRECCGFNFDIYPRVERLCADAESFAQSLELEYAESLLSDADRMWKGFPQIAEVRAVIAAKKKLSESLKRELEQALKDNRIYAARREYETLKRKLPGYSDPALESRISGSLTEAERLFGLYEKEPGNAARLKLLVQISSLTSDFPDIDRLIGEMPLSSVTRVTAAAERGGRISVKWDCSNEAGTAEYIVMRKPDGKPISLDDRGAEIVARTTERSFSDGSAEAGQVYYYAVCAARGSKVSRLCACREPVVLFPEISPAAVCGETSIEMTWNEKPGKAKCEVFRCSDESEKRYGSGQRVEEVFDGGFRDSGLTVGERYFYNIFFTVQSEGESYISEPVSCSGVTAELPMIAVKHMRNDGTSLHIELESFPENADLLFVIYKFGSYPESISDGTKLRLNRSTYERENIVIKSLEEKDYYISGFVRKNGDERRVFRALYENGSRTELIYSFSYSLLTGLRLNVRFEEESVLPELEIRCMLGAIPVNDSLGNKLCTVVAVKEKSKSFSINLSKLCDVKPADNMYAKVFVKDPAEKSRYIPMLDEGRSPKLKGR
ncbi:MAG: hypothetical protein IJ723_05125, partial [Ruminococcus sp.]|nr:hypothetical protein [Ruminococcus sp.]